MPVPLHVRPGGSPAAASALSRATADPVNYDAGGFKVPRTVGVIYTLLLSNNRGCARTVFSRSTAPAVPSQYSVQLTYLLLPPAFPSPRPQRRRSPRDSSRRPGTAPPPASSTMCSALSGALDTPLPLCNTPAHDVVHRTCVFTHVPSQDRNLCRDRIFSGTTPSTVSFTGRGSFWRRTTAATRGRTRRRPA